MKNIILKHELYFPRPNELNDPTDGRPRLASIPSDQFAAHLHKEFVLRHELSSAAAERERGRIRHCVEEEQAEMERLMAEKLNSLVVCRIYSLSKRFDNMALWAKYAENHQGYCLEFVNSGWPFGSAFEVDYGEKPTNDMRDSQQSANFLFSKSPDWSNEEEARIILRADSGPIVTIEPRLLQRVILGNKMTDAHAAAIRDWAQQRAPQLNVVRTQYNIFRQCLSLIS